MPFCAADTELCEVSCAFDKIQCCVQFSVQFLLARGSEGREGGRDERINIGRRTDE